MVTRRRFLVNSVGAAALAVSTALVVSPGAGARSSDRFVVTANGLRLRSGPGTKYRILASLAKGTHVRYLDSGGHANGYDWVKVELPTSGKVGFVAFQFLRGVALEDGRPRVQVASGPLNLRSAPGLGSPVIRTAPTGAQGEVTTEMPVTRDGYTWVNVRFSNYGTGWVARNFLTWL